MWNRWVWMSTIRRALPMVVASILMIDRCMMLKYRILAALLIIGT